MNLEKIKTVLFSTEAKQAAFIAATFQYDEEIQGTNFDEKFHFLFHNASEDSLQLVLAPFLREEVFQYLSTGRTEFSQATKQEHIKCAGESLFDEQINFQAQGKQANTLIYQDFMDLFKAFIQNRGKQVWSEMIQKINTENNREEAGLFSELKIQFSTAFPPTEVSPTVCPLNRLKLWDSIHAAPLEIQEFDRLRQAYITTWGQADWTKHSNPNATFTPTLDSISEEKEQEESDFPEPPSPTQDFNTQKQKYIDKFSASIWEKTKKLPIVSEAAREYAHQSKIRFIAECGQRAWDRIYNPPPFIAAFDAVKDGFIKKWSRELWDVYSAEPDESGLDPEILADFKERKQQFVDYWNEQDQPQAWDMARTYPEIPPDSLSLINRFKNIFITQWGTIAWSEYLETHRHNDDFFREYATDIQLKTLGELFDLRVEVTDITQSIRRTTMPLREHGAETVHLYCEDNTHYYVHENGYHDTIGDGNCGYNGFAQWLRFLVLGLNPRRAQVVASSTDADPETYVLIQNALLQKQGEPPIVTSSPLTIDSSIQPFILGEEITICSIRKELALPLTATASLLAKFIQTKVSALTQVIRARKLPYNRVAILQKISTLASQFGEQGQDAALNTLKDILLYIANSVYLPNTQDVRDDWTRKSFEENIRNLQACVPTHLPYELFQDLGSTIIATDFKNTAPESLFTNWLYPKPSYSTTTQLRTNRSQTIAKTEEDCLSATLCIAGIFILIAGISCLASLILLTMISGSTPLGILLMQCGFQTIATNLGAILGLSAPSAAVLAAGTAATMFAGLGFTLFKDSAPPSMLAALNPLLPNTIGLF